jgi:hypothetical protein
MPFMVIYRTSDGTACHEQADAIDEAALFVERLRNQDGIEKVHLYRMEEITFAFRPYYKVELGMPELSLTASPPSEVLGVADAAEPESELGSTELEEPMDADVMPSVGFAAEAPAGAAALEDADASGAAGRRGLFGR